MDKIITVPELMTDQTDHLAAEQPDDQIETTYQTFKRRLVTVDKFPNRGDLQIFNMLIATSWELTLRQYAQRNRRLRSHNPNQRKSIAYAVVHNNSPLSPDEPYPCHLRSHFQHKRY